MAENMDQAATLRKGVSMKTDGVMRRLQGKRALCCIAVASGKGGVGKTFLSSNLAVALGDMNKKVLLVDADLGLANADIVLGAHTEYSIQDVLFRGKTLSEVVTKTKYGVDLLAASSGSREMIRLGEARISLFIRDLISFAAEYDALIFDCAAGIDSSVTSFIAAAPQTLIVATPQPTSVMDVYALTKIIHQGNLSNHVNLVMNMADSDEQGRKVASALEQVIQNYLSKKVATLEVIPSTPNMVPALQARTPFVRLYPDDPVSGKIRNLARSLLTRNDGRTTAEEIDGKRLMDALLNQ